MLMWSYVGANWTSKLGDTSPEQGYLDMSIRANLSRDAYTEASVLPANLPSKDAWTEASVLPTQLFRVRVSWTEIPVLHIKRLVNPV